MYIIGEFITCRIGALINKNTFDGGILIRKGVLIGRRALTRIVLVSGL